MFLSFDFNFYSFTIFDLFFQYNGKANSESDFDDNNQTKALGLFKKEIKFDKNYIEQVILDERFDNI